MSRRHKLAVASVAIVTVGGLSGGYAIAAGGDDDDDETEVPITGADLAKAKAAALAEVPGRVTDTEVGDEESLYEVEVTRSDGSQVDVQLDVNFNVVSSEADDESEDGGQDD